MDKHGQPVITGFNLHQNTIKSLDALYGLCTGLMADGRLDDHEIILLDAWIKDNQAIARNWPVNIIAQRVGDVLADGVITEDERVHLEETLSDLLGGTLEDTGSAAGMATRLPVDPIDSIDFADRNFCFTGKFIYGPRKKCETAVIERGGRTVKSVTKDLHYLVIGTLASRDWAHTSHGRKIEKAIQHKDKGREIVIVAEEQWIEYL